MKTTKLNFLAAAILVIPAGAAAASEMAELTPDCDRALALSAGPVTMREKAGVYILGEDGFVLDSESQNGYVCMVVRENTEGLVPQCFDKPGQSTHVKVHLDEARKKRAGMSLEQIAKERMEGFASGKYHSAREQGVVYMASNYNYIHTGAGQKLLVAPHVMYHAPGLTDEDLGAARGEALKNRGMPFIQGEGPLGFMISFVERPTDSSDVETMCEGQLPDRSVWRVYP